MNISQVAQQTGLSSKSIRDYEHAGLIEPPERAANGYRRYQAHHIEALTFIKHAREVDFSLAQIAELLALKNNPNRASADVKTLVGQHIHILQQKIERLIAMKTTLQQWHSLCHGDNSPQCPIIDNLAHSEATRPNTKNPAHAG